MDQRIADVIANIQTVLGGTATIDVLALEKDILRVRFAPKDDNECPSCLLSPDDVKSFLEESLEASGISVREVQIEVAQPGSQIV